MRGTNHSHQRDHSNHSNPYNFLENGTVFYKSSGVTVGYCGGKVTVETLDRARAYMQAVPGAISGSRGHDQTFALANALTWGFGVDDAAALLLMQEWNAGCQPPWKDRDLRHKIAQARRVNHQKPFGYLLTAGERAQPFRQPQVAPPAETATWKIKCRPATPAGEPTAARLSEASEEGLSVETAPLEDFGAVRVPGCHLARPDEIVCSDDTWRALNAHPLGGEPLVHLALSLFGPDATLVSTDGEEVAS